MRTFQGLYQDHALEEENISSFCWPFGLQLQMGDSNRPPHHVLVIRDRTNSHAAMRALACVGERAPEAPKFQRGRCAKPFCNAFSPAWVEKQPAR
jgi:hypothetical protein